MLILAALLAAAAPAPQPTADPTPDDVATAVDSAFAERDWNGDRTLSRAEFGAWMGELRAAGMRHVRADAPETRTWVNAAFDRADRDRDGGVSEAELMMLLTGR